MPTYRVAVLTGPTMAKPVAVWLAGCPALRCASDGVSTAHCYCDAIDANEAEATVLHALRRRFSGFTSRDVGAREVTAPLAHPEGAVR